MKLQSLKAGRDGRLFVVSSDLRRATDAFAVASTLQSALEDWDRISPKLADLAEALEEGTAPHISFDPAQCAGDTFIGPRELGRAGERAAKATLHGPYSLLCTAPPLRHLNIQEEVIHLDCCALSDLAFVACTLGC